MWLVVYDISPTSPRWLPATRPKMVEFGVSDKAGQSQEGETKCACVLVTPVKSRWHQFISVLNNFVAPNGTERLDILLQSLVQLANAIGQSRVMAGDSRRFPASAP